MDVLASETVPCEAEVRAIARLLRTEGAAGHLPAWVSCACRDEAATGAGDSLAGECLPAALGAPAVAAFGVNCTAPRLVAPLLRVRALCRTHIIVSIMFRIGSQLNAQLRAFDLAQKKRLVEVSWLRASLWRVCKRALNAGLSRPFRMSSRRGVHVAMAVCIKL